MLARLQKFTTLGLLALAVLWAVLAWRAGHAAWAVGGAALIVVDDLASLEDLLLRSATLPAVLSIRVSGPDQRILSEVTRAGDGTLRPVYTHAVLTPPDRKSVV